MFGAGMPSRDDAGLDFFFLPHALLSAYYGPAPGGGAAFHEFLCLESVLDVHNICEAA